MLRIIQEALTFDDVLLVPGHSTVLPHTAKLQTRLTRGVTLNIPMVSAAMDTVSEARLAIALAQEGGIGFIHKNMEPAQQAKHVREVKKYESGVVSDPVTVAKDATIGEVINLSKRLGYSGFPVTDHQNNLIGIVTGRDLRFEKRLELPISNVMTGKDDLVTVKEGASSDQVLDLMHEHRIEKILVVDDAFKLTGLITVKDSKKPKINQMPVKIRWVDYVLVQRLALGQVLMSAFNF